MDRQYIREQMLLMLMHEDAELSEEEIRAEVAKDPALQREYEETLAVLDLAACEKAPPLSEERWREFSNELRQKIEAPRSAGVLVTFGRFFASPRRLAAAAAVAAAIVLGVVLVYTRFMSDSEGPEQTVADPPVDIEDIRAEDEYVPSDFAELDSLYATESHLLPSGEEIAIVEDVYTSFAHIRESAEEDELPGLQEFQFENLFSPDKSNGREGIS